MPHNESIIALKLSKPNWANYVVHDDFYIFYYEHEPEWHVSTTDPSGCTAYWFERYGKSQSVDGYKHWAENPEDSIICIGKEKENE